MCGCHTSKQCFITMACHWKLHAIISWLVISIKYKVRNNDIESYKNLVCYLTYRTDV